MLHNVYDELWDNILVASAAFWWLTANKTIGKQESKNAKQRETDLLESRRAAFSS